ncbi:hypothetical protein [Campylobacter concisus]|uniref:hypothetical protein n=1 Tax=Campylobacter concisus TaxID=199 RepID=UPI001CC09A20|nr:hypothetical protein [Campylobacter concisus]
MIEISNLSKHFYIGEKRIDVLRELNLSIKKIRSPSYSAEADAVKLRFYASSPVLKA